MKNTPIQSTETTTFDVEHTDTFGGEANYSWCTRKTLQIPIHATDRQIVRTAKAALGMTGVPCRKQEMGEMIALYPHGCCQVIFITPRY
jgi:hypothetical protein